MRQVSLDSIHLENFKSFTAPSHVALSKTAGLKFLGGRNLVEPRLGANGTGKSTLWDALCWCLYGTGVRGQRAAELVSWGQTQPLVVVRLAIDNHTHAIERRGSPNRLTIDKGPATQADVEHLVGLSRDRFLQSVVFGQGVPLFLDLSTAARGELLDSILDLETWLLASERASIQATALSRQITELDKQLMFEHGRLANTDDEANMKRLGNRWQEVHDQELQDLIEQVDQAEAVVKDAQQELAAVLQDDAVFNLEQLCQEIEQHEQSAICPACRQPIETHELHALNEQLRQARAEKQQRDSRRAVADSEVRAHTRYLTLLAQQAEKLADTPNPYEERLQELTKIRSITEARIAELDADRAHLAGQQANAEYWKQAFKKVRLFQVKQVLLRMEVETANAAAALGLQGWQIRYVTEVETKSGTMRPGIQVLVAAHGYEGAWENFSGGEAQRVRLAVALGLANMVQGLAGVNYQFEVFDESSQYLSAEGIEDLLGCLSNRAETTQKSIFISDHTQLSFGTFVESWQVTKSKGGSKVEVSKSN